MLHIWTGVCPRHIFLHSTACTLPCPPIVGVDLPIVLGLVVTIIPLSLRPLPVGCTPAHFCQGRHGFRGGESGKGFVLLWDNLNVAGVTTSLVRNLLSPLVQTLRTKVLPRGIHRLVTHGASICHVDDVPALPAELQVKLADVLTVSIQTFCACSFQQKECGSITSEDVKPLLECWRARAFPTSPLARSV